MRRLTIFVLVVAALYGGYWVLGARAVERGTEAALSQLARDGWALGETRAALRGFPSRFDTTVEPVDLTAPDGAWRYESPFWQIMALAYRPTQVIAVAAPTHRITLPGMVLEAQSDGLRASGKVLANTDLSFDGLTVEAARIAVTSDLGPGMALRDLLAAARPAGPAANTYEAYLGVGDVTLSSDDPAARPIARLVLDTVLRLDRPLDRHLANGVPPLIEAVTLRDLTLDWAEARLGGKGDLVVDDAGYLEGEVVLKIENHAALLAQLVTVGAIAPDVAPTWVTMGNRLAGGAEVLSLPLRLSGGIMSIGPLPIGPAPRLYLRG